MFRSLTTPTKKNQLKYLDIGISATILYYYFQGVKYYNIQQFYLLHTYEQNIKINTHKAIFNIYGLNVPVDGNSKLKMNTIKLRYIFMNSLVSHIALKMNA